MKVLVIAPHPDDETIGAGGTIARHVAQGDEIYLCLITLGYTPTEEAQVIARRQIDAARRVLGIQEVFSYGFPPLGLNTVPHIDLCTALQKVVDQVRPEIVYTSPVNDVNQDHRVVHRCSLVATRALPGCPVRRVLSYELATTTRFGAGFAPNTFIDISPYLGKKLEAMKCYETELRAYPHPRSLKGVRMFAEERGLSVGVQAAECFRLIREVIGHWRKL